MIDWTSGNPFGFLIALDFACLYVCNNSSGIGVSLCMLLSLCMLRPHLTMTKQLLFSYYSVTLIDR